MSRQLNDKLKRDQVRYLGKHTRFSVTSTLNFNVPNKDAVARLPSKHNTIEPFVGPLVSRVERVSTCDAGKASGLHMDYGTRGKNGAVRFTRCYGNGTRIGARQWQDSWQEYADKVNGHWEIYKTA